MIAFMQAADKGEVYNLSLTSNCARPESRDVRRFLRRIFAADIRVGREDTANVFRSLRLELFFLVVSRNGERVSTRAIG
jgi:hypothetical protein